jgi:hypothetical protein
MTTACKLAQHDTVYLLQPNAYGRSCSMSRLQRFELYDQCRRQRIRRRIWHSIIRVLRDDGGTAPIPRRRRTHHSIVQVEALTAPRLFEGWPIAEARNSFDPLLKTWSNWLQRPRNENLWNGALPGVFERERVLQASVAVSSEEI